MCTSGGCSKALRVIAVWVAVVFCPGLAACASQGKAAKFIVRPPSGEWSLQKEPPAGLPTRDLVQFYLKKNNGTLILVRVGPNTPAYGVPIHMNLLGDEFCFLVKAGGMKGDLIRKVELKLTNPYFDHAKAYLYNVHYPGLGKSLNLVVLLKGKEVLVVDFLAPVKLFDKEAAEFYKFLEGFRDDKPVAPKK